MKDKLTAKWSKRERDIIVTFPAGIGTNTDANYMVSEVFSPNFIKEMDKRGYDLSTLKFSLKPKEGNIKFKDYRPKEISYEEAWNRMCQNQSK